MRTQEHPDPAAIFAIATSLSREFFETASEEKVQALSDVYSGIDGFMRTTMQVATLFESWACRNVRFAELPNIWPYLLHDNFGHACRSILRPDQLTGFNTNDCCWIATRLRLPVHRHDGRIDIH